MLQNYRFRNAAPYDSCIEETEIKKMEYQDLGKGIKELTVENENGDSY